MTSADVSTPRDAATPTIRAEATSFEKDETLNGEPPEGIARFKLNTSVGAVPELEEVEDAGNIMLELVPLSLCADVIEFDGVVVCEGVPDAVPVIELVAVLEKEEVLLVVEVNESVPDEEDVIVLVGDGVIVALTVAVALGESEILEVIEADAPYERELVGD
jgi:hypothetical protein